MMTPDQPELRTKRLLLRPFTQADAPEVQRLAGAAEVADTTLNVPYPYADGMAEAWIAGHPDQFLYRTGVVYAVTRPEEDGLCGCVSLGIMSPHSRAELGYWLGVPFWGQGYATEAAAALVDYGFRGLSLHKITASHFARNPASGRVMQKIGMTREGLLRGHVLKDGAYEDLVVYGMVRGDRA